MGLLEQQKEIESKLHFYIYTYDGKVERLAAWVSGSDGSLRVDPGCIETKEESKALCQWYLSICDEL